MHTFLQVCTFCPFLSSWKLPGCPAWADVYALSLEGLDAILHANKLWRVQQVGGSELLTRRMVDFFVFEKSWFFCFVTLYIWHALPLVSWKRLNTWINIFAIILWRRLTPTHTHTNTHTHSHTHTHIVTHTQTHTHKEWRRGPFTNGKVRRA